VPLFSAGAALALKLDGLLYRIIDVDATSTISEAIAAIISMFVAANFNDKSHIKEVNNY
jgi:hypothetical protein